ncbi:hypothetical protein A9W95_24585 [Mycobacterium sp. 1423905.2]|nr:thiamine pyrophosphate-dependent enzyme [Mycobacterium sp. 1423905.2]OBJ50110.1 hypothetical protein A9W95_24585 [Mycobacterium sp. 1423905.2]
MTGVMMRGGDDGALLLAAGHAYNEWLADTGRVTVCRIGDRVVYSGAFDEVTTMAAVWQLPLVLLAEVTHLPRRAAEYGMPGVEVDGDDVDAVDCCVQAAVRRAGAGGGPTLVHSRPSVAPVLVEQSLAHRLGDRGGAVADAELLV